MVKGPRSGGECWSGLDIRWFGGVDKGNGAVEEGSIPVTHGDSILIHRDSTIQEQLKSRFESRQGSGLEMAVVVLYIPVQRCRARPATSVRVDRTTADGH